MTVKFFRNLHCFKGGGNQFRLFILCNNNIFFSSTSSLLFLFFSCYYLLFQFLIPFHTLFFCFFFHSYLSNSFFICLYFSLHVSCPMFLHLSVSTTMFWTNNLIMQWLWGWTKEFDSWGQFLKSAENFLVLKSQLTNCNPLWLKRWSFSMFYMKGKPRGLWSLRALKHSIGIVAHEKGLKRFGTIEKPATGLKDHFGMPRWMPQQCNI